MLQVVQHPLFVSSFCFAIQAKSIFVQGRESHVCHTQEQIFLCDVVVNLLNGNISLC